MPSASQIAGSPPLTSVAKTVYRGSLSQGPGLPYCCSVGLTLATVVGGAHCCSVVTVNTSNTVQLLTFDNPNPSYCEPIVRIIWSKTTSETGSHRSRATAKHRPLHLRSPPRLALPTPERERVRVLCRAALAHSATGRPTWAIGS